MYNFRWRSKSKFLPKDIRKYFFSHRVVSKWNMRDNDSVMAKTVNGFKTKLERERAKKMGLFLDWCLLGLEAVTEFRSGHPARILQVRQRILTSNVCGISKCVELCTAPRTSALKPSSTSMRICLSRKFNPVICSNAIMTMLNRKYQRCQQA